MEGKILEQRLTEQPLTELLKSQQTLFGDRLILNVPYTEYLTVTKLLIANLYLHYFIKLNIKNELKKLFHLHQPKIRDQTAP